MGRRDEPELEELSKLLRRLETMEVAPKQASPQKPEPEPQQGEYVGALRGATLAKFPEPGRSSAFTPQPRGTSNDQRPASSKAIIIGAATAAVVSSVVAAAVVVMTSGAKRSDDASRLTFLALKDRAASGTPLFATADTGSGAAPVDAQRLLQRADAYLRTGKPDDARLVLEQAARAGSGVAALTLGAMYDPGRVAQFANVGVKADPTVARAWYERAKDLGIAEAKDRLAELAAK